MTHSSVDLALVRAHRLRLSAVLRWEVEPIQGRLEGNLEVVGLTQAEAGVVARVPTKVFKLLLMNDTFFELFDASTRAMILIFLEEHFASC